MTVDEALDAYTSEDPVARSRAKAAVEGQALYSIPHLIKLAERGVPNFNEFNEALVATVAVGVVAVLILGSLLGANAIVLLLLGVPAVALAARWLRDAPHREEQNRELSKSLRNRVKSARDLLDEWEDIRAVGPLCETLEYMSPIYYVPPLQEAILTRLLPKLKASDYHLLRPEHRARLYAFLQIDNALQHADYLIAILHALEQVGDAQAIPYVQAVAEAVVTSLNGTRVRAAARRCLPYLQQREEVERAGRILLRAAEQPDEAEALLRPADSAEGILLRPSGGAGSSAPEQLLRAPHAPEDSDGRTD